jgi:NADPH-dependent 2,4-dienoyl-CoA reductase/sulfur reductase-like enzyme
MVPRIVIVGAGPAGVRCAETLVAAGLRPTLIDENRRDGGQIYRRQPENFTRSYQTLYGTEAHRAAALHSTFDRLRGHVDYVPETLVWNVAERQVYMASGTRQRSIAFDSLVLCTGAADRLMPLKGWNLAGAYSLGGAQVALKSQACAIGRQIAFAGTGALLYLVAAQYAKAGANVVAVLDTSPRSKRLPALSKLLVQPSVLYKGAALELALRRAGIHIYTGVELLEITGSAESGVQGLAFREARGRERRIECDAVGLGYHLRPETQLADLARCEFQFDAPSRQWLPQLDLDGRTSVRGVYIAGDGARVLGANAAEASGKLAALAILKDLGFPTSRDAFDEQRRALKKFSRFARGLAEAFPWPAQQAARIPNDAIVCRCESVTAGELRGVIEKTGAREANRAKAFSRVGMGRCQGRYCGHAAAEIIAHAAAIPIEEAGRLRGQAPVKPLPVALTEDEQ